MVLHAVRTIAIVALFVFAFAGWGGAASTAHASQHGEHNPAVLVTADVSSVVPGEWVTYEVTAFNLGNTTVNSIQVMLPYQQQHLSPVDSNFEGAQDWVSELTDERVVVTFGPIAADTQRAGTITFQVAHDIVNYTALLDGFTYEWQVGDHQDSAERQASPVLAVEPDVPEPDTAVAPQVAAPGTAFQFYGQGFAPGEMVVTWLNTPAGVQPLELSGFASGAGEVWFGFESAGLQPGAYSLVKQGMESQQTGVTPFIVE